ncbi:MAG: hypothetical protein QW478_13970 [Candidatus Micrarchaeaceae archaeon]
MPDVGGMHSKPHEIGRIGDSISRDKPQKKVGAQQLYAVSSTLFRDTLLNMYIAAYNSRAMVTRQMKECA